MIHRKRKEKGMSGKKDRGLDNFEYFRLVGDHSLNFKMSFYTIKKIIQQLLFLRNQIPSTYKTLKSQHKTIDEKKRSRKLIRSSDKRIHQLYCHIRELQHGLYSFFDELIPTRNPVLLVLSLGPSILFPKEVYIFRLWTDSTVWKREEEVDDRKKHQETSKESVMNTIIKQFIMYSFNFSSKFPYETKLHLIALGKLDGTPLYFSPCRKARASKKKNLKFFLFDICSGPDDKSRNKEEFVQMLDNEYFQAKSDSMMDSRSIPRWYISSVSSRLKGYQQKR